MKLKKIIFFFHIALYRVLCENTEDIGSIQPLVFMEPDVNNRKTNVQKKKECGAVFYQIRI